MTGRVSISARYCKGCGLCVTACPKRALRLTARLSESGLPIVEFVDGAQCTACTNCAVMCPDAAITIEVEA